MQNPYTQPRKPWEYVLVILAIFALLIVGVIKSHAQRYSHCEKEKIFVAGFNIEATADISMKQPPVPSLYFGVSGIYGKGTILDNFCATIGTRYMKTGIDAKTSNDILQAIPIASVMYRLRFNGEDSKLIHAFAATTSIDRTNFRQYDYRIYGAPDGHSFATVGGLVGWNNLTGVTIGFTAIGFF